MPLRPGSRHGIYLIGELIGKGGMGEVYQGRDTKLDRNVAIKVLPESVAKDRDLLIRFEREAKTLASLNHPNIAHIYGLEESGGNLAIVMEFVSGPTLADRIKQGPVPLEEALPIARQIANALEAAHDIGVIHRDLKPANVKITPDGQVKLLDFGLAKSKTEITASTDLANSPTVTLRETEAGVILGTAGYMAPEQIRGTHVDKRVDIWAFGVVLFELLSGKRLFTGPTVSDILAATLRADIDWTALPANTPPEIEHLIDRCLQRDRKLRLRDIGDAAWSPATSAKSPATPPLAKWPVLAAAILATALLTASAVWYTNRSADPPLRRLPVSLGTDINLPYGRGSAFVFSPDGTRIAYITLTKTRTRRLLTRRLDQAEARVLSDTDDAEDPFFSPDGQWIGFFAGKKLRKLPVEGGSSIALAANDSARPGSGSWGANDQILASLGGPLVLIPASGGPPQPVTTLTGAEIQHAWPQLLPGEKAAVFGSHSSAYSDAATVEAVVLATGARKVLRPNAYSPRFVPTGKSTGYLTWLSEGNMFAAPMDPDKLELTGPAKPILERVSFADPNGGSNAAFAADGTLAYAEMRGPGLSTVMWWDPSGAVQPLLAKPAQYGYPVLSPDGKRLAYLQTTSGNRDLWVLDLDRDVPRRLTNTPESEYVFVWTPDGKWIIYSVGKQLRIVRTDGSTAPLTIYESKSMVFLHAISPDGKYIAFCEQGHSTGNDLFTATLEGTSEAPKVGTPTPFQATPFIEIYAGFSPDGKWLAYSSDESGTLEVYVRPFPSGPGKYQISSGGGKRPLWSPNGRELFFHNEEEEMMVVDYKTANGALSVTKPRLWSHRKFASTGNLRNFTITPDGKRFAVVVPDQAAELDRHDEVIFLENFVSEIRRKLAR